MALEQKLHLKLAQKLVMTPTLQQAIKLLQLSRLELEQVLAQEVQANPLLEMNDEAPPEEEAGPAEEPPEEEGAALTETTADSEQTAGETTVAGEPAQDDAQPAEAFGEVELEALFSNYLHDGPSVAPAWEETEEYSLENSPAPSRSMFEDLSAQLHLLQVTPEVNVLCEFIIGNLDPDGYLRVGDEEMAHQLGVAVERIREAITTVQRLEPAGIGARSLQECFLLQLERLPIESQAELVGLMRRIVAEAFDDLLLGLEPSDGAPNQLLHAAVRQRYRRFEAYPQQLGLANPVPSVRVGLQDLPVADACDPCGPACVEQ